MLALCRASNSAIDRLPSASASKFFSFAARPALASSAVTDHDYDTSLEYYIQLKNLGYTGIQMNYYATNVESGEEESFSSKQTRDFSVKAKSHSDPKDDKSESKTAEIVKNIALIYVSQGENEKALGAMADARAENPDDLGLLLSEANVYLKMGNREKFKALMEEATRRDPDNAELQYNPVLEEKLLLDTMLTEALITIKGFVGSKADKLKEFNELEIINKLIDNWDKKNADKNLHADGPVEGDYTLSRLEEKERDPHSFYNKIKD